MSRWWMGLALLAAGVAAAAPGRVDLQVGERWTVQFGSASAIPFTVGQVSRAPGRSTAVTRIAEPGRPELLISAAVTESRSGTPGLAVGVLERARDGRPRPPRQYCIVNDFSRSTQTRFQGEWVSFTGGMAVPKPQGRCVIEVRR